MYKIEIKYNNEVSHEAIFNTEEECTSWYEKTKNSFPKNHTFNTRDISSEVLLKKESEDAKLFLNESDYKVLRHIRQKALNLPLTMTEAEYLQLEQQRHEASIKVK